MSMNSTPRASRTHIALFGRRNAGKSSVINALTNQNISLVSEQLGTTTDPVFKSMEILPLGPVVLIDTAGIDDVGDLGELRVQRTYDVINKTDIGLIIFDVALDEFKYEFELIKEFNFVYSRIGDYEDQRLFCRKTQQSCRLVYARHIGYPVILQSNR